MISRIDSTDSALSARHVGPLGSAVLLLALSGNVAAQGTSTRQAARPQQAGLAPSAIPRRPFPQHTLYPGAVIEPNHVSQASMDDAVRTLYDLWKARYVVQAGVEPDGHPRFRVRIGRNPTDATVSEGQGYGMLLTALLAGHDPLAQQLFDGLWEFSLDHRSTIEPRLMDWYVNADEGPDSNGDDCAFDGDCDMALALLLAQDQWGNRGRFDYGAAAASVLEGLWASAIGPQSKLPLLGDWVSPSGSPYNQWTPRSSDLMPDHFRSFEAALGDGRWNSVLVASQALIDQVQLDFSSTTGLLPDFLVPVAGSGLPLMPAPGNFLEGPFDGAFYYNACRDPWRIATDAVTSADATSTAQALVVSRWIRATTLENPQAIRAGYGLDGSNLPGSNFFTTAFAAPMAVAALLDPEAQTFLNALYDAISQSDEGYFEDSIALLCLVVVSNNWWQVGA